MNKELLERIANEHNNPSVTISMKTHRTFPDNQKDEIRLRNLLNEASDRLVNEFGKKEVEPITDKIKDIMANINVNYHLDSLHIFLSKDTTEIIKSPWPTPHNKVHISERFAIKPLIIMNNRVEDYLVLLLSKTGVNLYKAQNDRIVEEVKNDWFPSNQNPYYLTDRTSKSDSGKVDSMLLEYFNTMDKAVVKVNKQTGQKCVVVSTEDNYAKLLKVADVPSIYAGYAPINYNDNSEASISKAAWEIVQKLQKERRAEAIKEMQSAVNSGQVVTDLGEIYRAALEGRADLFVAHNDFVQAVKMTGEGTFELIDDVTIPGAIDDITSEIAREVIAKKGRVIFTSQEEIKNLGDVALKVRY